VRLYTRSSQYADGVMHLVRARPYRKLRRAHTYLSTPARSHSGRKDSDVWTPRAMQTGGYDAYEAASSLLRGQSIASDIAKLRLKGELRMLTRRSRRRGRVVWSGRFFAAVSELYAAGLTAGEIAALLNSPPSNRPFGNQQDGN
jgi:hypothetical protein